MPPSDTIKNIISEITAKEKNQISKETFNGYPFEIKITFPFGNVWEKLAVVAGAWNRIFGKRF